MYSIIIIMVIVIVNGEIQNIEINQWIFIWH